MRYTWVGFSKSFIVNSDCGGLTDPAGGSITFTDGSLYNSVATFECDPGFHLTGSTIRLCQADGFWSGAADQACEAISELD